MNNLAVLASLQSFLNQRAVDIERLTADGMINVMVEWFRLIPIDGVAHPAPGDSLLYRYGGWSEGCATGFKFTLLRRIASSASGENEWLTGITLMFEPSRYADVAPLITVSTDWQSLEAFVHAIESSPGFRLSVSVAPLAVMIESQGFR
jgi:hypothetical protein